MAAYRDMTFFSNLKRNVQFILSCFFFNHFAISAMKIFFCRKIMKNKLNSTYGRERFDIRERERRRVQQIKFRERKGNWHGKEQREFLIEPNKVRRDTNSDSTLGYGLEC